MVRASQLGQVAIVFVTTERFADAEVPRISDGRVLCTRYRHRCIAPHLIREVQPKIATGGPYGHSASIEYRPAQSFAKKGDPSVKR